MIFSLVTGEIQNAYSVYRTDIQNIIIIMYVPQLQKHTITSHRDIICCKFDMQNFAIGYCSL